MEIVRPHRVCRTYVQHLRAAPADVFPLLCPVREVEWVGGWDPGIVVTESGFAELGCVFTTDGGAEESIWVVTEYQPEPGEIAFLKVTPALTVAHIRIRLEPDGEASSVAHVTYEHTALSPAGRRLVDEFTEDAYRSFMETWETALNDFLSTRSSG